MCPCCRARKVHQVNGVTCFPVFLACEWQYHCDPICIKLSRKKRSMLDTRKACIIDPSEIFSEGLLHLMRAMVHPSATSQHSNVQ